MNKFPKRFQERIHELLPQKEWNDFFHKATEPLPRTIRIATDSKLIQHTPSDWQLSPVSEMSEVFFIERTNQREVPLGKTLEHFSGEIYVASLSSLLSVHVLDPKPGERILDLAAAPGSKTTFIADKMGHSGVLVANEPSSSRSAKLSANLNRMGVSNCVLLQQDGASLDRMFGEEFDRILLDAPCSSEGFGRKKSDFFQKSWTERTILESAKLQRKLIFSAFNMLSPGGTMVYSTCTSAPEENEMIVQHLLEKYPSHVEILPIDLGTIPHKKGISSFLEQKACPRLRSGISSKVSNNVRRIFPHLSTDRWDSEIFFLAKIRKRASLFLPPPSFIQRQNASTVLQKKQSATIIARTAKYFGMERSLFEKYVLTERNGKLFLSTKEAAQFASYKQHQRVGLPFLDQNGVITSSFAIHFGKYATQNTFSLSEEEKNRWLEGYDLEITSPKNVLPNGSEVLVFFERFCLGLGKVQQDGKKIKNKLERSIVF